MITKEERRSAIRDIISGQIVSNQEELLKLLKGKGFNITQATLSRDIKVLKISKAPDANGNYIYTLPAGSQYSGNILSEKDEQLVASGFISIDFSGALAVIKTRPGYAMAIASDIDSRAHIEIIGTIAGDDTILLIPREGITRERVIKALSAFIPNIKFN